MNKEKLLLEQNITISAREYVLLKELEENKNREFDEYVMLKEVIAEMMQERGVNTNLGLVEVKGAIRTPSYLIKRLFPTQVTLVIKDFGPAKGGGEGLNVDFGDLSMDTLPLPRIIITNLVTERIIEI